MIELKRTSRDHWWLILPLLTMFTGVLTYVALAAYSFVPQVGAVLASAALLAPPISVALWLVLGWYIYRLISPVHFLTSVSQDSVVFRDSRRPHDAIVLNKNEIRRFFVQPSRWWHTDGHLPVVYESCDGTETKISMNFVYDNSAAELFDAIELEWGPSFVSRPATSEWLATEIRLWPKKKESGEPSNAPESRGRAF